MKLMGEASNAKFHNSETRTAVKNLHEASTAAVKSFDLLPEAREYNLYHYTRIYSLRADVAFNQTFFEHSHALNRKQETQTIQPEIPKPKSPEEVTANLRAALQRDLAIGKMIKSIEKPKATTWAKYIEAEFDFGLATTPAAPRL